MNAVAQVKETPVSNVIAAAGLLDVISRAASDPNMDVDKLERLLAMHERITARDAEQAFNEAMSTAQAELRPVSADATNPQTRSKYATYGALDKAVRPIYTRHGFSLSFSQADGAPDSHVRVQCRIGHSGGHTRIEHVDMPADGKGAKGNDVMTKTHATGSAFSYGQRYLLKLLFNISIGEDDDGNRAGGETITTAQADEICALMQEVAADGRKFLQFMKVERVLDIQARDYRKAIQSLEAKRGR